MKCVTVNVTSPTTQPTLPPSPPPIQPSNYEQYIPYAIIGGAIVLAAIMLSKD